MKAAIDAAGRVVIPKQLRDELALVPGTELEIRAVEGRLEIEPMAVGMHLEHRQGGPVAVVDEDVPELTAEAVREVLERTRR
jgi:AbrB family looped-hinge helix DNA binding protein